MKNIFANTKVASLAIVLILFISSNLLLKGSGWVGGACLSSLTDPNRIIQAMHSWIDYGFPLFYLRVTTEGCFAARNTYAEFFPLGFLADIVVFLILGVVLSALLSWRRPSEKSPVDQASIPK